MRFTTLIVLALTLLLIAPMAEVTAQDIAAGDSATATTMAPRPTCKAGGGGGSPLPPPPPMMIGATPFPPPGPYAELKKKGGDSNGGAGLPGSYTGGAARGSPDVAAWAWEYGEAPGLPGAVIASWLTRVDGLGVIRVRVIAVSGGLYAKLGPAPWVYVGDNANPQALEDVPGWDGWWLVRTYGSPALSPARMNILTITERDFLGAIPIIFTGDGTSVLAQN